MHVLVAVDVVGRKAAARSRSGRAGARSRRGSRRASSTPSKAHAIRLRSAGKRAGRRQPRHRPERAPERQVEVQSDRQVAAVHAQARRGGRPVRRGHHHAGRRQALGGGKLADGARDALGHRVVVGAQDDHARDVARCRRSAARRVRLGSAVIPRAVAPVGRIAALEASSLDAQLLGHQEQRPALHLLVHAPEVLADHAERDELHAGEEHDRDDQGREARHVGAVDQRLDQEDHGVAEGEQRDHETEVGPHPERDGRERGDAVEREAQQLARPPARAAAAVARRARRTARRSSGSPSRRTAPC